MRYSGDMYECDLFGTKDYLTSNAPKRSDWIDVKRVTADGADKVVLMCPDCYALYKKLVEQDERNFNKFIAEGAK